ncbi:mannose-P-dolichol utilization defect 1 protein [Mytilinidion resinicola]|uniref:Mannose-P-dolichol utilization defect 1 protein homolog n=1 Tax=Mytilinidion resinicola TaxID=574789 RepID=A0A6A6Z160_9PEZI|nr:mannose-P-dolichol utilization defect 1 protein [Mytilinidion resinicola]KAF2814896.1 mannose-P-dolichol utilization defect 1 protein [Mytilinidion resinicola]
MESALGSVRSLLQPITHNLPAPITSAGRSLLGPFCYKTLVLDIDPLTSPECLKLAISKGLGIGIIGASSIVKIPQLIKLINSQSAAGVSFLSYLLETSSYLISLSYNVRHGFPFSTYGETALILVQNVVIASLVLRYSRQSAGAAAFIAGLGAAGAALFQENVVDVKQLAWLQAGAGVLGVASKVPQIYAVWSEGGTGQLSAFAVFNYLAGSLSRIFTTLQEVPDPLILYGFIAGFALNLVLAVQMVWYWNSSGSKKTKSSKLERPIVSDTKKAVGSSTSKSKAKTPTTRRRG